MLEEGIRCFHCGEGGHETIECPYKDQPRSQAGREAYKHFFKARKGKKKVKGALFNYFKVKKQMRSKLLASDDNTNNLCIDPLSDIGPNLSSQKRSPPMVHAYREFFDYFVGKVENELKKSFQLYYNNDGIDYNAIVQPYRGRDQSQLPWQPLLSEAVRNGEPADFSLETNNRIYALQKLETRTRYLHHLIMDWNIISNKVREAIISRINACTNKKELNIASLGGGPGYDHVAFCCALLFLRNLTEVSDYDSVTKVRVNTKVFDLFGEWDPVIQVMDQSLTNAVNALKFEQREGGVHSPKDDDISEIKVDIFHPGGLSLQLCDIRESLYSDVNADLSNAMADIDIVVFQFVMHENASILLSDDDNHNDGHCLLKGAVRDILANAKVGTLMICTDSHSFIWPHLKATAMIYGWTYFGAMERGSKIRFGPKQFVLLERVHSV